jgi:type II secretory pathway component PulJ
LTPEEKQIVEKTEIPSEVTEQMAQMYKNIIELQTKLEAQEKRNEKLTQDFTILKKDLENAINSLMREEPEKVRFVKQKS